MCLQPAHARVINTHFAVLIWVPLKLKATCCSVPACLARGNQVVLVSSKLEAVHAQVHTMRRRCEKHGSWGSWPEGRSTARAFDCDLSGGEDVPATEREKGKVGKEERKRYRHLGTDF